MNKLLLATLASLSAKLLLQMPTLATGQAWLHAESHLDVGVISGTNKLRENGGKMQETSALYFRSSQSSYFGTEDVLLRPRRREIHGRRQTFPQHPDSQTGRGGGFLSFPFS